jgi:parallel beta-helix repeat protein
LVWGSGTIYIRADGSVYPPTAPIQHVGDEYSFSGNITDTLVVEKDSVIIDGEGYSLLGTGGSYTTGLDLSGRYDVTVRNLTVASFWCGIMLDESSSYCKIRQNHLVSNTDGVSCDGSNNIIEGNNVTGPAQYYGISLLTGSSNVIEGNIINMKNTGYGIHISNAGKDNVVAGNSLVNCNKAINVYSVQYLRIEGNNLTNNGDGIYCQNGSNSTISGNNIIGNYYGFRIYGGSNNSIFSNNIVDCFGGMWLAGSSDNFLYHNNFINNTRHVYTGDLYDSWDNGYPSGGNYWDNYTGVDGNGDGIGDTPFVISGYNIDRYPLIEPIVIPEFQPTLILPFFVITTLLAVIVYRRKQLIAGRR